MLFKIPFDDFYEDVPLEHIGNKKSVILALLDEKDGLGTTQVHKLLFLAFAEGKILLPFSFAKYHYGPFSDEITCTLNELEREGIIQSMKEKVITLNKNIFSLASNWQNKGGIDRKEILGVKEILKKTIDAHDEGARSLEKYCYKTYFLMPKTQSPSEWRAMVKNRISDLRDLLNERKKKIEDFEEIEETKRVMILSSFDYISSLLDKLYSTEGIDQVIQGVLIKNSEDYINLWGEVLRLAKEGSLEEIKRLLLDIRKTFSFINEVAARYLVFESIFDLQET